MTEQPAAAGAAPDPARLERVMAVVPRFLASHVHIFFLLGLLVYLVILPALGIYRPSPSAELIGGNWTNVTSDIGACIAAGGTVHLVRQQRKRMKIAEATHKVTADLYRHHVGEDHPAAIPEITGPRE